MDAFVVLPVRLILASFATVFRRRARVCHIRDYL